MSWSDYKENYLDFEIAVNQSEIISLASFRTLENYPNDLPEKPRERLFGDLLKVGDLLGHSLLENDDPPESGGNQVKLSPSGEQEQQW